MNDMLKTYLPRLLHVWLIFGLVALTSSVSFTSAPANQSNGAATPADNFTLFLPLVRLDGPPPTFGVQLNTIDEANGLSKAVEARTHWVRGGGLPWSWVEPTRGARNWAAVASQEQEYLNAAQSGLIPIVIVGNTPAWAQQYPGVSCGPIKPGELAAFGAFMYDVVTRYSAAPYHVKYWEIWNEPDVDPNLVAPNSPFGCWGDDADPYYGGGYYAEMLKIVYPQIKAADPQAQVMLGGLLLDCDPTYPPAGQDCKPANFLEGVLRAGGGPYFDEVGFHGYPQYNGLLSDWENTGFPTWVPRGGVVAGKANFLREVLSRYGVSKPLFHSEGSLICPEDTNPTLCANPDQNFWDAQAAYVPRLFLRNWAEGYLGTAWYTLTGPGWRHGGMLDANQQPRPAYLAYSFMTSLLTGYRFQTSLYPVTDDRVGYRFTRGTAIVEVYWTKTGAAQTVAVSPTTIVYDTLGITLTVTSTMPLGFSPTYVVTSP